MYIPTYTELSEEQLVVLNLPEKGRFLVTGPPGTGKTVMALKRAEMANDIGMGVELIMMGKPLSEATSKAANGIGIDGDAKTYHSYLWRKYFQIFRKKIHQIEPYVHDWDAILEDIDNLNDSRMAQIKSNSETLIIDEGQDMNKHFYLFVQYLFDSFTIFADDNQRLHDDNSRLKDIRAFGGTSKEYYLNRNYRNTRQIAELALEFHTGVGKTPDLPTKNGNKPILRFVDSFQDSVNAIVNWENNFPNKSIGIFTNTIKDQIRINKALSGRTSNPTKYYNHKVKRVPDLTSPGIKLITYESAKGLEFDAVFIPEIQRFTEKSEEIYTKMMLYVLITRARETLYITFNPNEHVESDIMRLFPSSETGLIKYIS
jgi:superfamily I DNA/RNA helicase